MREIPMLFSAPMVRAILEGRKTMTRRVVKPQPALNGKWMEWSHKGVLITEQNVAWHPFAEGFPRALASPGLGYLCPYGQPGDRLWVRETWHPDPNADHEAWDDHTETYVSWSGCGCRIDGVPPALRTPEHCIYREAWDGSALKWRPAIHMPRWASRLTLEITGVRVERLKDISEADAIAEGLTRDGDGWRGAPDLPWFASTIAAFRSLWESINGTGSWEDNPLVWVVEFKRQGVSHE